MEGGGGGGGVRFMGNQLDRSVCKWTLGAGGGGDQNIYY